ncbi:MAG: sulfotransferase family protein [Actinocatenispora sp.]
MKIIGAGFGRTGTLSLKAALERLGFGPCFHMSEVFEHQDRIPLFLEAGRGGTVDWDEVFAGYESTVDWPGCSFWRELVERYPDAKVLLSVRDPKRWYMSVRNTIYQASHGGPPPGVTEMPPEIQRHRAFVNELIWQGEFEGRADDEEFAISRFVEHNEAVRREVPADRLLEFETAAGWDPLCRFLGVEAPDEPFPHLNDSQTFGQRVAEKMAAHQQGQ